MEGEIPPVADSEAGREAASRSDFIVDGSSIELTRGPDMAVV